MSFEAFVDVLKRLQDHRSHFEETVSDDPELLKAFDDLLDEEPDLSENNVLVTSNFNGTAGFFFDTRYGLIHAHYMMAYRGGEPGFRVDKFEKDCGMRFVPTNFERKPGYEGIDFGMLVGFKVKMLWPSNERKPKIDEQHSYTPRWTRNGFSHGFAETTLFKGLKIKVGHFENLVNRHIKCTDRNLRLARQKLFGNNSTFSPSEPTPDLYQNYLKDKNESEATPASNNKVTWKVTSAVMDMSNVLEPEYNPLVRLWYFEP